MGGSQYLGEGLDCGGGGVTSARGLRKPVPEQLLSFHSGTAVSPHPDLTPIFSILLPSSLPSDSHLFFLLPRVLRCVR